MPQSPGKIIAVPVGSRVGVGIATGSYDNDIGLDFRIAVMYGISAARISYIINGRRFVERYRIPVTEIQLFKGSNHVRRFVRYGENPQIRFAFERDAVGLEPLDHLFRSEFSEGMLYEFASPGIFSEQGFLVGDSSGDIATSSSRNGYLFSEYGIFFEKADMESYSFRDFFHFFQNDRRAHHARGSSAYNSNGLHI